jgi:hypothetical protein
MDLQQRLTHLENVRDWQGLVDELEKGIQAGDSNAAKAAYHLQLGYVLEGKFLSGVKALKHFQDAYKLNPALVESLAAARQIYWDLGKLNMVQKLLELELKSAAQDAARSTALLVELGDVLARPRGERRCQPRGSRIARRRADHRGDVAGAQQRDPAGGSG